MKSTIIFNHSVYGQDNMLGTMGRKRLVQQHPYAQGIYNLVRKLGIHT